MKFLTGFLAASLLAAPTYPSEQRPFIGVMTDYLQRECTDEKEAVIYLTESGKIVYTKKETEKYAGVRPDNDERLKVLNLDEDLKEGHCHTESYVKKVVYEKLGDLSILGIPDETILNRYPVWEPSIGDYEDAILDDALHYDRRPNRTLEHFIVVTGKNPVTIQYGAQAGKLEKFRKRGKTVADFIRKAEKQHKKYRSPVPVTYMAIRPLKEPSFEEFSRNLEKGGLIFARKVR